MPKMTKYERNALKLVNRIRKAEGRAALTRLPKGNPEEEFSCPIARALDHGNVGIGETVTIPAKKLRAYLNAGLEFGEEDDDFVTLVLPKSFDAFMSWFDRQEDEEARALAR